MAAPIGPYPTLVDRELQGVARGAELQDAVTALAKARATTGMAPTVQPQAPAAPLSLTWGDFQCRHPEWRGEYWAECRALYAGGERLLGDPALMKRLFPSNAYEDMAVYKARCARAHYFPYPGTICDHLLAGLGSDPLKVSFALADDQGAVAKLDDSQRWWQQWVDDVTDEAERPSDYGLKAKDGAKAPDDDEADDEGGRSIHRFCVDVLREALQTQAAWVLADLPGAEDAEPGENPDPYLCLIPAERVIDWQYDDKGRLLWAIVMTCEQIRLTPKMRRGVMRHTYVMWDAYSWAKYVIDVDPALPPHIDTPYTPVGGAPHEFGRVPIERLCLPDGLYAMGKLHSLAREHFNKRCAMGWAEFRSLYAQLYEFQGPSDTGGSSGDAIPEIATDTNRATNQVRSVGHTQVRGNRDRAEYIGPPPATFTAARESCNDAMREMHRVMFSMALSANMDNAALQRSGESKQQDKSSSEVILDAFAELLRPFVRRLFVLASLGRSEPVPPASVTGLESFDVTGVNDAIAMAIDVFNGIPLKSARFVELFLARTYGQILGDVTQEDTELMREQIREQQSAEELLAQAASAASMATPDDPSAAQPGESDQGDPPPAPAPKAKPPAGPMRRMKKK